MERGSVCSGSEAFNNVALPTKIAEYCGQGLKVIAINSAGAYTSLYQGNSFLGYVFEDEESYLKFKLPRVNSAEQKEIASFAKANYSLSANYMKYMLLYNALINKAKEN